MAEKKLLTRIIMNHGEWASYSGKVAKDGEVIYVKVGTTQANGQVSEPIWMQKIGDGVTQVQNLPWVVAPAADVYAWAKKASLDPTDLPAIPGLKLGITVTVTGTGNAVTDASWDAESKTLTLTKGETFATKAEFDAHTHDDKADKVIGATAGNFAGLDEGGNLTDSGKKAADFATAGHTHEITATDDDIVIATGGPLSVDVKHKEELGAGASYAHTASTGVSTFGGTATINVPQLTVNKYGHITAIADETVQISLPTPEEVTLPSVVDTEVEGQVVVEVDQTDGEIAVSRKAIDVVYGEDGFIKLAIDGTAIGTGFDASDFVKDSYLSSASYDDETHILTLTFIDNEDKLQPITVDLSTLVDVYSADEVTLTKDGSTFKIKDGGVGTTQIANKAVTTDKIADLAVTEAKIDTDAVTTAKIKDANVTKAKLAKEVTDLIDSKQDQFATLEKVPGMGIAGIDIYAMSQLKLRGNQVDIGDNNTSIINATTSNGGKFNYNGKEVAVKDDLVHNHNGVYKPLQGPVYDPTANGKSLTFIDTISQDNEGVITATKKNVNLDDYALKSEIPTDFGVTKVSTTANNGLKVTPVSGTGDVTIDIDDTVVFILDGGTASDLK